MPDIKRLLLAAVCCLIFIFDLQSQDITVKRERAFTGTGLYGFMNGGADLYFEYGVTKLTNRDIVYNNEHFTVDMYEMPTPEDAYGIYSIHVFRCERADTLGCIDCLSPYQLQAVHGNMYITVVFPSGSAAARKLADEVLRIYVPMDETKSLSFPQQLNATPPYSGKIKYARGPLSVLRVSTSLYQLLKDVVYANVWFSGNKSSDEYTTLVTFNDPEEMKKLKGKISAEDLLSEGENCLYLRGKEKPETEQSDFGF